jgi:hypothetical protein
MEGGTTYHFLDVPPAEALETALEAADGKDVRIGGGATVIRDFLAAGLSTTCTSCWSPSCSAEASGSGMDWRASEGLPGRGHGIAQRSHACDLHPCRRIIRCLDQDTTPGRVASSSRLRKLPYVACETLRSQGLCPYGGPVTDTIASSRERRRMNVLHIEVEPGRSPSAGLTEARDAARGQGSIVNVASKAPPRTS